MNRKKPIWRWLLWLGGVLVGVPLVGLLVLVGAVLLKHHQLAPPKPGRVLPGLAPDSVRGPLHTPALGAGLLARFLLSQAPNELGQSSFINLLVPYGRTPLPAEVAGIRVFSGPCQVRKLRQAEVLYTVVQLPAAGGTFEAGDVVSVSGPGVGSHVQQFTVGTAPSHLAFAPQPTVRVGSSPRNLHAGDVDGDGDLDLLAANASDSTVSVRLNDGHGAFGGGWEVDVRPQSLNDLAVGDINGDGYPDLVTSDAHQPLASTWLNDGHGRFAAGWAVDMGCEDASATLGDVDGDGDLDLLFAVWGRRGVVNVRFNDGAGAFGGGSSVAVDSYPSAAVLGDVDNDGDLDLLTANYGATRHSVSVRLNNGRGTFGGGQDVTAGYNPSQVVLGDVDADGDLDLVARDDSHTARLLLNGGRGTFGRPRAIYLGGEAEAMALADMDGDGDLDLVAALLPTATDQETCRVGIWPNDGHGFFLAKNRRDVPLAWSSGSIALADIDHDGDLDLLAAVIRDDEVNVRRNE